MFQDVIGKVLLEVLGIEQCNKDDKAPAPLDLIFVSKKVKMLVSQLCLTLCDSMNSRPL